MKETYHSGERFIQEQTGEIQIADRNGRVVTNQVIKGAINFIEKQPMAIVSSQDQEGKTWISALIGEFGLTTVPSPNELMIHPSKIHSNPTDVFYNNVEYNPNIGMLFIELSSRRRFRINGKATSGDSGLHIEIEEAYPNCPKYIQRRTNTPSEPFNKQQATTHMGSVLDDNLRTIIQEADTFFVGSKSNNGSMDASHRGGNPGFIEFIADNTIRIPDYQGNSMYNTLGNFTDNPNAGLLFIDYEKGNSLQLTGTASILFNQNSDKELEKTTGTGRFWTFTITQWIQTLNHHSVNWDLLDHSPFNP